MKTIRELRRERGWTQFELALAVGVQPQTVYLWESGRRLPQVPQMRRLGQVFGLCSDEIALEAEDDRFRKGSHRAWTDRRSDTPAPRGDPVKRSPTRGAERAGAEVGNGDGLGALGRPLATHDGNTAPTDREPREGD